MREGVHSLGGEQSGHIIFLEYNTTGYGLWTAIQLLTVIKEKNTSLSKLAEIMTTMPQVLVNAHVKEENKKTYMNDEVISSKIAEIEKVFDGNGRVLIRPSGTEALVRVMIEGNDKEKITKYANELAELIEGRLK